MDITLGPAAAKLAQEAADQAGEPVAAWIERLIVNDVQKKRRRIIEMAKQIKDLIETENLGPTFTLVLLSSVLDDMREREDRPALLREQLAAEPFEVLPHDERGVTVYDLGKLHAACQRVLRRAAESCGSL